MLGREREGGKGELLGEEGGEGSDRNVGQKVTAVWAGRRAKGKGYQEGKWERMRLRVFAFLFHRVNRRELSFVNFLVATTGEERGKVNEGKQTLNCD